MTYHREEGGRPEGSRWPWVVTAIYACLGSAWILAGAFAKTVAVGTVLGESLEIAKGLAYVAITAVALLIGSLIVAHRYRLRLGRASPASSARLTDATARIDARRLNRRIAAGVALFLAAVAIVLGIGLRELRIEAIEEGANNASNLAELVAAHTERMLTIVDIGLHHAGDVFVRETARGQPPAAALEQHLGELPGVAETLVFSAQGIVVAASDERFLGHDFSARPYIAAHAEDPAAEALVSGPFRHPLTGEWLVTLTRPLPLRNGEFASAIGAGIEAKDFGRLWSSVDVGTGGSIALFHADGRLLMRSPLDEAAIGASFASTPVFAEYLLAGPEGTYRRSSAIDGTDRVFAYRTLGDWPQLVTIVGFSLDRLLAPWWRHVLLAGAGWLGLAALALVLASMLSNHVRRRAEALDEIAELARFPLENPNPVLRLRPDGSVAFANPAAAALAESVADDSNWQRLLQRCADAHDELRFSVDLAGRRYLASIAVPPHGDHAVYLLDATREHAQAIELKRVNRDLRVHLATNRAIGEARDGASLLDRLCGCLVQHAGMRLAWVVEAGAQEHGAPHIGAFAVDSGALGKAKQRMEQVTEDPQGAPLRAFVSARPELGNGSNAPAAFPVLEGGVVVAVMALLPQQGEDFDEADLPMLGTLASDVAFALRAIDGAVRVDELQHAKQAALLRVGQTLRQMIVVLGDVVERRDPYTAGHHLQVANLAERIARKLDLPAHQIEGIRMGALIHDIGKIGVPSDILTKPGRLSVHEFELVRMHASAGREIVAAIDFEWPIARIVGEHHERLDGSGYPNGLAGDEICLEVRIVAVADVADSMLSHRPYRAALPRAAVRDELRKGRGKLYDADVVDACLEILDEDETTTS